MPLMMRRWILNESTAKVGGAEDEEDEGESECECECEGPDVGAGAGEKGCWPRGGVREETLGRRDMRSK